jgi:hypothetical protein
LIKQGFTNFEYVVVDDKGAIDKKNAVDGNLPNRNDYSILVL